MGISQLTQTVLNGRTSTSPPALALMVESIDSVPRGSRGDPLAQGPGLEQQPREAMDKATRESQRLSHGPVPTQVTDRAVRTDTTPD